jgi:hypothetical protein
MLMLCRQRPMVRVSATRFALLRKKAVDIYAISEPNNSVPDVTIVLRKGSLHAESLAHLDDGVVVVPCRRHLRSDGAVQRSLFMW